MYPQYSFFLGGGGGEGARWGFVIECYAPYATLAIVLNLYKFLFEVRFTFTVDICLF